MSEVTRVGLPEFTSENWQLDVLGTSQLRPVLVEFFAPWCESCRHFGHTIESVSNALLGQAVVGTVNCDAQRRLCREHKVRRIPQLLVIRRGVVVERPAPGPIEEADILALVRRHV